MGFDPFGKEFKDEVACGFGIHKNLFTGGGSNLEEIAGEFSQGGALRPRMWISGGYRAENTNVQRERGTF